MPTFRQARPADRDAIVAMMRDFYAHEKMNLTAETLKALDRVLCAPGIGEVHLVMESDASVGYFVLMHGFSLEHGGATGLLDELFIIPAARGKGIGKAALARVMELGREREWRVVYLEVSHENTAAHELYTHAGFTVLARKYLTRPL
jgi:ribosomal protein S18 acetylase RimI-like enzyme